MKIAVMIVRILIGLMFLFATIVSVFKLMPQPDFSGNTKAYMEGLAATTYFLPLLAFVEFICAVSFLSGFFVPLATVVIFPVILNIFLFHAFLDHGGLPIAVLLIIGNLFLAYYYRDRYKEMLKAK